MLACRRDLLELARQIGSQFNALSPTAKLPDEILSRVFMEVHAFPQNRPQKSRGYSESDDPPQLDPHWLHLAQVCRRWRAIALQLSELWSDIQIISEEHIPFVKLQLERSGVRPLAIHAHVHSACWEQIIETLIANAVLQRLATLQLTFRPSCGFEGHLVLGALVVTAPSLRRLSIINGRLEPEVGIKKQLFSGALPRLQDLTLYHLNNIDWDWPPLTQQSLLHLRLRQTQPVQNLPTLSQLYEMLSKLPSTLITLELPDVKPSSTPLNLTHPIAFNHLQRLLTSGSASTAPDILRLIRVAPSTRLNVVCSLADDFDRELLTSSAPCPQLALRSCAHANCSSQRTIL